ncbi:MAG: hypothetical protein IJV40_03660 [Oscillospiraceae bacterium]|nr:hypothetical protein [Oscillospiraceae bacterium]
MSNEEMIERQRAAVLCCIRTGKDMANTRHWIAMHTGLNDRVVRNRIEELRNEGHLICNTQNGRGYYIAEDIEDIKAQYKQDCARAMSILRRIKPFRHALRELEAEERDEDQITMLELLEEE